MILFVMCPCLVRKTLSIGAEKPKKIFSERRVVMWLLTILLLWKISHRKFWCTACGGRRWCRICWEKVIGIAHLFDYFSQNMRSPFIFVHSIRGSFVFSFTSLTFVFCFSLSLYICTYISSYLCRPGLAVIGPDGLGGSFGAATTTGSLRYTVFSLTI